MLVRFFKKNTPAMPVFIVLAALVLWADSLFFSRSIPGGIVQPAPFFEWIMSLVSPFRLLQIIIGFVLLLIQAFIIQYVVLNNSLLSKPSWLPGFLYVVLMSSDPALLSLNPVLLSNLFLLWAMARMLNSFAEDKVLHEVFNAGLLTAIASLFYFPAAIFFIWVLLVLIEFFLFNLKGVIAAILGFITPFFFLLTGYFLFDKLNMSLFEKYLQREFFLIFQQPFEIFPAILISFVGLLSLVAFFHLLVLYSPDKPVRIRKRFRVIFAFFIIAVISVLGVTECFHVHHGLLMMPLTIALSVLFMEMKRKWMAEVLLYLLLALVLAGKVIYLA
jgi:hypothetical protein